MKSLISKEVKSYLTKAGEHELTAHLFYRWLSNVMQSIGFFGAQKHFDAESEDEMTHYKKIADYCNDRGDLLEVTAIPKQTDKPKTLKEAFEMAEEIELDLGRFYEESYSDCVDIKDYATAQFLLQFIEIQYKSVGEIKDVLSMLEIAGENSAAILQIDAKLGA